MVNEDDKFEGQEEGEYHFSDDQMNYEDVETETPKAPTPPARSFKENLIAVLSKYRRMIIGVVVFFGLIFLIYKMLTPGTQAPTTDFTPATANKPIPSAPPKPPKSLVPTGAQSAAPGVAEQAAPPQVAQTPTPPSMPPVAPQLPEPNPMAPPAQITGGPAPSTPPASMPQAGGMPVQNPMPPQPQLMPTQQPANLPQQPTMAAPISPMPTAQTPPPPVMSDAQNKVIMDKLASLEEQNAKFMSSLQTQFAQKMGEYENQITATQERERVLSRRMGNMEASLNKMSQLLQEQGIATRMPVAMGASGLPPPPAKTSEPRLVYTVQAIIPGRAWLKADSGDTVTVAEGDILKDYGRVTKIDPYDGIVEIDTGTKVITLSYGSAGD